MVTLEKLDELEGRILRTIEIISDLRSENSRLEQDNSTLREKLSQKDQEVADLRTQLEETSKEFDELRSREGALEEKITSMLSRLDGLQSHGGKTPFPGNPVAEPSSMNTGSDKEAATSSPSVYSTGQDEKTEEDESVVIIEDNLPSAPSGEFFDSDASLSAETEEAKESEDMDEDLLLLEDQVNPDDETIPSQGESDWEKASEELSQLSQDDDSDIFEEDEDDDFMILEEDNESNTSS